MFIRCSFYLIYFPIEEVLIKNGDAMEVEIRGCSIQAIEVGCFHNISLLFTVSTYF